MPTWSPLQYATIAILNVSDMNDSMNQQALRIDENMPLLALDLLSCVVARGSIEAPLFQRFYALLSITRQWDWLPGQSLRGILHRAHDV